MRRSSGRMSSYRESFGVDGEQIAFECNISQDLRHWKSSRKTCKNKTFNLRILKSESSSCLRSMILIGREEEIHNLVFQIPNKSRITRRNYRMGHRPRLLEIPKSECPDIWIRLPRQKWPKSWSDIEDPAVLLERNLYGHPLAGLLW